MFEGKEFEKQIGDIGHVSVDVTPDLKIAVEVAVKKEIDLMQVIKDLAAKTDTKIDDSIVEFLQKITKK